MFSEYSDEKPRQQKFTTVSTRTQNAPDKIPCSVQQTEDII